MTENNNDNGKIDNRAWYLLNQRLTGIEKSQLRQEDKLDAISLALSTKVNLIDCANTHKEIDSEKKKELSAIKVGLITIGTGSVITTLIHYIFKALGK